MRALHTLNTLSKPSRRLTALLLMPLILSMWMLNLTPTTRGEEGMEMTIPLKIVFFDAAADPLIDVTELYGQIEADNPAGLTVTLTGDITGSTTTDSSGGFIFTITNPPLSGVVVATVSQGSETSSMSITL